MNRIRVVSLLSLLGVFVGAGYWGFTAKTAQPSVSESSVSVRRTIVPIGVERAKESGASSPNRVSNIESRKEELKRPIDEKERLASAATANGPAVARRIDSGNVDRLTKKQFVPKPARH